MMERLRMLLIITVKQLKSTWPSQKESNYEKFDINYSLIFSEKKKRVFELTEGKFG